MPRLELSVFVLLGFFEPPKVICDCLKKFEVFLFPFFVVTISPIFSQFEPGVSFAFCDDRPNADVIRLYVFIIGLSPRLALVIPCMLSPNILWLSCTGQAEPPRLCETFAFDFVSLAEPCYFSQLPACGWVTTLESTSSESPPL